MRILNEYFKPRSAEILKETCLFKSLYAYSFSKACCKISFSFAKLDELRDKILAKIDLILSFLKYVFSLLNV